MIDSEVSDKIKYRWEGGESHLDFENIDVIGIPTGSINTEGGIESNGLIHTTYNVTADENVSCNALYVKGTYKPLSLYVSGKQTQLSGDQLVNHQLYLHCVKLTSATKTVYVNVISEINTKATNKNTFWALIDGGQGAAHVNWYYGTDTHLVHAYYNKDWQTIDQKKNVVIDGEPVTAFEGFDPMNILIGSNAI